MNLDETQKERVKEWIRAGATVSEIQTRLGSELGVSMTYMEVRFLLDDLKLNPADKERAPDSALSRAGGAPPPSDSGAQPDAAASPSGISVSVDQIARPGAVVSGKATFSDGQTAEWHLDQMGRLGLAPAQEGYRPSQSDLMAFQEELQNALARSGF